MGVRGLCRLISRHESQVSIRLDLSSLDSGGRSGLVFDGSSLLYHVEARVRLLNPASLHAITGGCLPEFAQVARDFISPFLFAQIPIWVVFDGVQCSSKRATRILRRKQVLVSARSVELAVAKYCLKVYHQTNQLTEINVGRLRCTELSEAVLMDVLRDMNVPISVAIHEADSECVRLCNEVRALGVVGEDSDYFVFDQNGGYIPLSSIVFDDDGSVYGRLYRVRAIANILGIPVSFLPVVASLGGNDIVVEGLPELQRLHKTLKLRSSTTGILEQILAAAKSFHSRRPDEAAMAFLQHFIQTSVTDQATAKRLYQIVESEGVPKYEIGTVPVLDSTLLKLHYSGNLCCGFALDVYLNRFISVPFGVGYSSSEDIRFVSDALFGLRQRLCYLVMSDVHTQWSIPEVGLGIEFDDVVIAEENDHRPSSRNGLGYSVNVIDQCHDCNFTQTQKEKFFRFVLFGGDERNIWLSDSVFMNVIRFLMATCAEAESVAAALVKMHQSLQSDSVQRQTTSLPPKLHIRTLRLCAVFRHALLLAELANSLTGWPLKRSKLEHCFDGATFHQQLSSFLS